MRMVTRDGDGYRFELTLSGATFVVSSRIPAGLTVELAAQLVVEAHKQLFLKVEAERLTRIRSAERKAGEE